MQRLPQSATRVDVNVLDTNGPENKRQGKITIDSGAAESVIPPSMFVEVPIKESAGSRAGLCYIAANGGRIPNLGEKRVKFRTTEGMNSSVMFQVTFTRKPLASVSRITNKGNKVVFAAGRSYVENVKTGQQTELTEEHGTYHMDVGFLVEGYARQARDQLIKIRTPQP
jgi:hypothetical protein